MAEGVIDEIDLPLVEPESDGKGQGVAGFCPNERFMHALVMHEVRAIVPDRLLPIPDHAEASGAWGIDPRLQPAAGRVRRTRDLEKDGKLGGIGVLRFVENDDRVELPKTSRSFR